MQPGENGQCGAAGFVSGYEDMEGGEVSQAAGKNSCDQLFVWKSQGSSVCVNQKTYGRYNVMLEPLGGNERDNAIIMEFKVRNGEREKDLEGTLRVAHRQMDEKEYAASLEAKGIPAARIRKYGFAFEGKRVLIG